MLGQMLALREPLLVPKALAIAHGQVPVDGASAKALLMCPGHSRGTGQVPVDGAIAGAMAMATAMAMAVARAMVMAMALAMAVGRAVAIYSRYWRVQCTLIFRMGGFHH